MFGLSPWELLLIFLAILLLFGAKRLPEIGSSLGRGIREFKGSIKEVEGNVRGELPKETSAPSAHQETAQPRTSNTEV
ncbi:Sec-independent protein translocase subunit TatA/TatB [Candidatus Palauibacter sp.]|jgi:sec-independent protein translocase protein TatA|uniref:Sec-independent protein translocase subunit TatA/TatB n=1 Tax=Candidatus Palauibacter sp. TaxID=3101350 RepID=UPI003AF2C26F